MSTFDFAVVLAEKNLNNLVGEIFARDAIRQKLFSGQAGATIEGLPVSVAWGMRSPPAFRLTPPTPQQWERAVTSTGDGAGPRDNACVVTMPDVDMAVTGPGDARTNLVLSLDLICTISFVNQTIVIVPLGLAMDLSGVAEFDQIIYKSILIPELLDQAKRLLESQALPKIEIYGMSLGAPTLLIEDGRAVAAAYLSGTPGSPDREALRAVPGDDLHVLLSREALQIVVQNGVQSLRGRTETTGGQAGFGIGRANYSASLRLDSLEAEILAPTTLRARAGVTVQASAGVDVLPEFLGQVGQGVTKAAETVGKAVTDAGNAIANAFKSY